MNVIPPILRLRCTQPDNVTCLLMSEIRNSPQVCDLYILLYYYFTIYYFLFGDATSGCVIAKSG